MLPSDPRAILVTFVIAAAIVLVVMAGRPLRRAFAICLRALTTIAILVLVLWVVFCDRVVNLSAYDDGRTVLIVGRIADVVVAADGVRAAYDILDPFGDRVRVVSNNGPPSEGTFVLLRGYKGSAPDIHGASHYPFLQDSLRWSLP